MQQAVDEDVKQNYPEACKQYQNSLDYFTLALKGNVPSFTLTHIPPLTPTLNADTSFSLPSPLPGFRPNADHPDEKNDKSKRLLQSKIDEYRARAETLRRHLAGEGNDVNEVARALGHPPVTAWTYGTLRPCPKL